MNKRKANWTCSYCSKILQDPILLPCDDSICCVHLSEKAIVNANRIKCNKCKQEHQIKENQFRSINEFKKLITDHSYLSEEEISLKQELEKSIRKFFETYDQFTQNETKLETIVLKHFEEMRSQIDQHRDKLKEKIDQTALAMKDETKSFEKVYLNSFKENVSSFDHGKSLDTELNEVEETFRNPNILIATIKEMQRKQEASLNEIQLKLNEMTKFKEFMAETNEFQPNLSSFDPEDKFLFGSIKFSLYSDKNSLKSQILKGEQQCSELLKLCQFSSNDKWSLLYRGTRDGFGSDDFHSKCDGHANTLTILKAKFGSNIFGGFTSASWDGLSEYKSDANAFLFSLTNRENKPLKMKIKFNQHQNAIFCNSEYGPTFGFGHDIYIDNNANTTMNSYSFLGSTYKHPKYGYGKDEAQTFFSGSKRFLLDEIEVYQRE